MPELPEVETVRLGLIPVLQGRCILRAQVNRPDLRWPLPPHLAERLSGRRVAGLRRRSKYLLADLDRDEVLLVHLGMSGRMLVSGAPLGNCALVNGTVGRHDHVILDVEGGARVTFNDARRFGMIDLLPAAEEATHRLLRDLGPEPLGNRFDEALLGRRLEGRKTSLKAALLDQHVVAGLGNIYVCEALWRARLSPLRPAGSLTAAERTVLVGAIREVLAEAIAAGGSSLRDHRRTDGELGYFQHSFRVYGREGEPCPRPGCAGHIRRVAQGGRSTWFCPVCQGWAGVHPRPAPC